MCIGTGVLIDVDGSGARELAASALALLAYEDADRAVAMRPRTAAPGARELSDPQWAEFLKRQSALLEVAGPQTRFEPLLRVGTDSRWQHSAIEDMQRSSWPA